jgi:hypothetical protein
MAMSTGRSPDRIDAANGVGSGAARATVPVALMAVGIAAVAGLTTGRPPEPAATLLGIPGLVADFDQVQLGTVRFRAAPRCSSAAPAILTPTNLRADSA